MSAQGANFDCTRSELENVQLRVHKVPTPSAKDATSSAQGSNFECEKCQLRLHKVLTSTPNGSNSECRRCQLRLHKIPTSSAKGSNLECKRCQHRLHQVPTTTPHSANFKQQNVQVILSDLVVTAALAQHFPQVLYGHKQWVSDAQQIFQPPLLNLELSFILDVVGLAARDCSVQPSGTTGQAGPNQALSSARGPVSCGSNACPTGRCSLRPGHPQRWCGWCLAAGSACQQHCMQAACDEASPPAAPARNYR